MPRPARDVTQLQLRYDDDTVHRTNATGVAHARRERRREEREGRERREGRENRQAGGGGGDDGGRAAVRAPSRHPAPRRPYGPYARRRAGRRSGGPERTRLPRPDGRVRRRALRRAQDHALPPLGKPRGPDRRRAGPGGRGQLAAAGHRHPGGRSARPRPGGRRCLHRPGTGGFRLGDDRGRIPVGAGRPGAARLLHRAVPALRDDRGTRRRTRGALTGRGRGRRRDGPDGHGRRRRARTGRLRTGLPAAVHHP